jgi:hypothetical protein
MLEFAVAPSDALKIKPQYLLLVIVIGVDLAHEPLEAENGNHKACYVNLIFSGLSNLV